MKSAELLARYKVAKKKVELPRTKWRVKNESLWLNSTKAVASKIAVVSLNFPTGTNGNSKMPNN